MRNVVAMNYSYDFRNHNFKTAASYSFRVLTTDLIDHKIDVVCLGRNTPSGPYGWKIKLKASDIIEVIRDGKPIKSPISFEKIVTIKVPIPKDEKLKPGEVRVPISPSIKTIFEAFKNQPISYTVPNETATIILPDDVRIALWNKVFTSNRRAVSREIINKIENWDWNQFDRKARLRAISEVEVKKDLLSFDYKVVPNLQNSGTAIVTYKLEGPVGSTYLKTTGEFIVWANNRDAENSGSDEKYAVGSNRSMLASYENLAHSLTNFTYFLAPFEAKVNGNKETFGGTWWLRTISDLKRAGRFDFNRLKDNVNTAILKSGPSPSVKERLLREREILTNRTQEDIDKAKETDRTRFLQKLKETNFDQYLKEVSRDPSLRSSREEEEAISEKFKPGGYLVFDKEPLSPTYWDEDPDTGEKTPNENLKFWRELNEKSRSEAENERIKTAPSKDNVDSSAPNVVIDDSLKKQIHDGIESIMENTKLTESRSHLDNLLSLNTNVDMLTDFAVRQISLRQSSEPEEAVGTFLDSFASNIEDLSLDRKRFGPMRSDYLELVKKASLMIRDMKATLPDPTVDQIEEANRLIREVILDRRNPFSRNPNFSSFDTNPGHAFYRVVRENFKPEKWDDALKFVLSELRYLLRTGANIGGHDNRRTKRKEDLDPNELFQYVLDLLIGKESRYTIVS